MPSASSSAQTFDPRKRRLCPDGACIGLIGADGRCKVCGLEDKQAPRGLGPEAFAAGCAAEEDEPEDQDVAGANETADLPFTSASAVGALAFDPKRALCPDGACIGVIGPDGRCKVCGQSLANAKRPQED
jgi:hypothetical protein